MTTKSKHSWGGAILWGATSVIFAVAGVACLIFGVVTLWRSENIAAASTGLTAGLALLLAASIDRFEVLKGLGVEARMRKMDDAISQANATIEQLRALAASLSKVALTDLMSSNFMSGTTLATRLSLHDKLLATLGELGLNESQIKDADSDWRKGIGVIYHRIVRYNLGQQKEKSTVNSDAPQAAQEAANDFQKLLNFGKWLAPSPEEMETFINERGLMTSMLREWIDDYKHYLLTGEIRRSEEFSKG